MKKIVITGKRATTARGQSPRTGASLVEVLVVLVILLIGVSAIVRVFPLGFQGLRAGENRTLASRLATQQMEQIKADQDNLMQGVLFRYHAGNGTDSFTILDELPDSLGGYDPDGDNPDDDDIKPSTNPYWTDVNKYRFIEGERVKIPLPTPTGFGRGSVHVVKFGPIYVDPEVLDPSQPFTDEKELQFLQVRGTPMRGISVNVEDFPGYSDPVDASKNLSPPDHAATRLRGAQTYLIDYNENSNDPPMILFPKREPPAAPAPARNPSSRVFVVSYSYDNGSGEPVSVTERITVEDNTSHEWLNLSNGNVFIGSDTVSRAFTRLPNTTGGWDNGDPYQYKLLSGNIASGTGTTNANFGILAFNPAGANYTDRTPYGEQPFAALVDYMVLDWHILREDRQVPQVITAGGRIPIKLTLNYLKRFGEVEADQTAYKGIYSTATTHADDIQVFDLQTGRQLQGAFYDFGDAGAAFDPAADFFVNTDERGGSYRTGTVYLNSTIPAGTQVRVLYKADGDWAVAVQKAYSRYERRIWQTGDSVPAGRPDNYDNFHISGHVRGNERIYFRSSELNKSVVVTLEYRLENGQWTRTAPLHLTIDRLGSELDTDTGKPQYAYIDLNPQGNVGKYMPGRDPSTDASNAWRVFGNITGSSLKVRVIWRDNSSTTNTWRVEDLDTYLDRPRGVLDILRR